MGTKSNVYVLYYLQACDITGGTYLKLPTVTGLLQYLLVSILKQIARHIYKSLHVSSLPLLFTVIIYDKEINISYKKQF